MNISFEKEEAAEGCDCLFLPQKKHTVSLTARTIDSEYAPNIDSKLAHHLKSRKISISNRLSRITKREATTQESNVGGSLSENSSFSLIDNLKKWCVVY